MFERGGESISKRGRKTAAVFFSFSQTKKGRLVEVRVSFRVLREPENCLWLLFVFVSSILLLR